MVEGATSPFILGIQHSLLSTVVMGGAPGAGVPEGVLDDLPTRFLPCNALTVPYLWRRKDIAPLAHHASQAGAD